MLSKEKAVVVFSGGQDSTTCLFWAKKQFKEIVALTFDYGQRHDLEIQCAKEIAAEYQIPHKIIHVSFMNQLTSNALTRMDIDVQSVNEDQLPATSVDGRNHMFFSIAAILAKQVGAKHIITGVSQTDYSGYPDCRDGFIKALNVTLNLAMDQEFVIHAPLMWLTKAQTWKLADELGAFEYIRDHTLTCYQGIMAEGCGVCPACKLRNEGLEEYLTEREGDESEQLSHR